MIQVRCIAAERDCSLKNPKRVKPYVYKMFATMADALDYCRSHDHAHDLRVL